MTRRSGHSRTHHVALVGFMGAGKSTVGRRLAARGHVRFVDLDEAIETTAGESIAEIFHNKGEVGFRALERRVLRETLAAEEPAVIATGGGTFIDPAMRAWLKERSCTVFLQASVESLLRRIGEGEERQKRPLLMGPDAEATVERLHASRLPAYEECALKVDTDGRSVDEVTTRIERLLSGAWGGTADAEEYVVEVSAAAGEYPVICGDGDTEWAAAHISRITASRPLFVLTDSNVAPLHADALLARLRTLGHAASLHIIPAGEAHKHQGTIHRLYDDLLNQGAQRQHVIVAVGGGVLGDMAGFVAATLLRGIDFVQVPTTTLAAVDSSVGGKTGFNSKHGKNLIGAFHAPIGVVLRLAHLRTLPAREHRAGLVEALKMAATFDSDLFDDMVAQAKPLLAMEAGPLLDVLRRSIIIKADVVAADERETGVRAVLNLGHTIGHAIEVGEEFSILHGEAVGLGMVAEAEFGHSMGLVKSDRAGVRMKNALNALEVDTRWRRFRVDVNALRRDKKAEGEAVRLPLVNNIGSYVLEPVIMNSLCAFVQGATR